MMPFAGLLVMFSLPQRTSWTLVGPRTKLVSEGSAGMVLTKPESNFPPVERKHYKLFCSIRTAVFPSNLYHKRGQDFSLSYFNPLYSLPHYNENGF